MTKPYQTCLSTIEFQLRWEEDHVRHTDVYFAERVNLWRDVLPEKFVRAFSEIGSGDRVDLPFSGDDLVPPFDPGGMVRVDAGRFDRNRVEGRRIEPKLGRFYPKGFLKDVPKIYRANMSPFRCTEVSPSGFTADLNHPLTGKAVRLAGVVHAKGDTIGDNGGTCVDWMEIVCSGPGMQGRYRSAKTDFFSDDPFVRADEEGDSVFYQKPRLVTHVDDQALKTIRKLYARLLQPDMKVLDLMSSYKSHLPESVKLKEAVGLGMNKEEMEYNPQLTSHLVHDLNRDPRIPAGDAEFDAVVCSVSVDYLVRPVEVFSDVARVLKPGGPFVLTFSNRWFPTKVTRIWTDLHEFERVGLVTEYFLETERFDQLETFSARGWPRPTSDIYFPDLRISDPVYAVWGRARSNG